MILVSGRIRRRRWLQKGWIMQGKSLAVSAMMLAALGGGIALKQTASAVPPAAGAATLITTADGIVRGQVAGDVVAFKGVPFAAPPVGALRWREPMPVAHWSGTRDALAYGPPCAQAAMGWNSNVAAKSSEDCLYLD